MTHEDRTDVTVRPSRPDESERVAGGVRPGQNQAGPPQGAQASQSPPEPGAHPAEPEPLPATDAEVPPSDDADNPVSEDLAVELEQARAQAAEMEDRWRRAVAELDNFRKRTAREVDRRSEHERSRVAAAWLPVVDSLELALDHAAAEPAGIVDGVRAVRDQALSILAQLGYPRRDDVGEKFDPQRHDAVATTVDQSVPPGTVVHVIRPRYGDPERLLRPAAVVVAGGET